MAQVFENMILSEIEGGTGASAGKAAQRGGARRAPMVGSELRGDPPRWYVERAGKSPMKTVQ